MADEPNITLLLSALSAGSQPAVDKLIPLVYAEMRALAEKQLQQERPGHTLQATALVHEAYLRLVDQRQDKWQNRAHFFALAAQAIRRILVDHARGRKRLKRGGGAQRVSLDGIQAGSTNGSVDLLALEEGLSTLAALDERQARLVELRFFGGLSMPEIAEVLGISLRTVEGDWAMARAWLRVHLRDEEGP